MAHKIEQPQDIVLSIAGTEWHGLAQHVNTIHNTKMKKSYHLKCLAPDGAMVTEGRDFDSVESAWRRADEMGSRWIFFPVSVVTTEGGIIRSLPENAPCEWLGRNVKTMAKRFAEDSEAVAEYCNGYSPLCVWP